MQMQDPSSMLFKFFQLQVENPTKGDWVSACLKDLKELRINESFEEIKKISKEQFNKILKKRIHENALCYLKKKQHIKGKEILYESIELADYLQPYNNLSIIEKLKIFEMRNRMTKIPNNFLNGAKKVECFCGEEEEMAHVYECNILSSNKIIQIEY